MTSYLFRNRLTGEIRRGASFPLNSAARLVGIDVLLQGGLPDPWQPWEHWDAFGNCVWHYTETGDCVPGPRP
jgi:hypothetical protein